MNAAFPAWIRPATASRLVGCLLALLLLATVGLETMERHDHGVFESDGHCLACRIANAPVETPPTAAGLVCTHLPDLGSGTPPAAPCPAAALPCDAPRLRGPPTSTS